jgi:hypothetical protein
MRWITIVVFSLLAAAGCRRESAPEATRTADVARVNTTAAVAWESDEAAAYARARTEHKGVLVYFFAAWCAPCVELERNLTAPAAVEQLRRGFVPLRIDATDGDDRVMQLRERYGATTMPAIVMTAADGAGREGEGGVRHYAHYFRRRCPNIGHSRAYALSGACATTLHAPHSSSQRSGLRLPPDIAVRRPRVVHP